MRENPTKRTAKVLLFFELAKYSCIFLKKKFFEQIFLRMSEK